MGIVAPKLRFLKISCSSSVGAASSVTSSAATFTPRARVSIIILVSYRTTRPALSSFSATPFKKLYYSHGMSNNAPGAFPSSRYPCQHRTHTHTMRVQKARDLTIYYNMLRYYYYNNYALRVILFLELGRENGKTVCVYIVFIKYIHAHKIIYIIMLTLYILCNLRGLDIIIIWSCVCVCVMTDKCWKTVYFVYAGI